MPNVPIAKYPMEEKVLITGQPIPSAATTVLSSIFPVGKGAGETWERIRLVFHFAFTAAGVWTFPDQAGAYAWIRNILLETSDGETIIDCPGSALFTFNRFNDRAAPWYTPFVVACTGLTFDAVLDLPFGMNFLRKPEDGYLDSGVYSGLRLTIQTGTAVVAGAGNFDFGIGNAGANAMAVTFDMSIIRTKAGSVDNAAVKPLFIPYIKYGGSRTPTNTAGAQFIEVESANDLALFGFLLANGGVARFPFDHVTQATGLSAEIDSLTDVSFGDNIIPNLVDHKMLDSFRLERHRDFKEIYPVAVLAVPNIPVISLIGKYNHLFVRDGSVYGAYPCGNKTQIRVSWAGGAVATDQVDLLLYGFRNKRRLY